MPLEDDRSRPAVLYVEEVNTQPDIEAYLNSRRVSSIDIEINTQQAKELIEYLTERQERGIAGSIRIRYTGRLIHL